MLKPLPPYSPDFNPIEQVFAKLKALLRKASERTVQTLWNTLAKVLDQFTPAECENDLSGAGIDSASHSAKKDRILPTL